MKDERTNLNELQTIWNKFICSAISAEYNKFEQPVDLEPVVDDLYEKMKLYVKEIKNEQVNDRFEVPSGISRNPMP
jgi:hypothetical protein